MPKSSGQHPSADAADGRTPAQPVKAARSAHPPMETPKTPATSSELRFEEAYSRLVELVGEMERGELPLEDLLQRFEEGVKLVRHCQGFLKDAQLKVEQYVELKDGQWVLKDSPAVE